MKTNVVSVRGDFCEKNLLESVLDGVDVVFHMACTLFPAESNEDPYFDVLSNVCGTITLLEKCVEAKISKFLFMSSGGTIYGKPQTVPTREDHPQKPECSYGITKLTLEHYLRLFATQYGLSTYAFRLSNPYGRFQNPFSKQGAVAVFAHNILHNIPISIWGDGNVQRDFICVDDFVSAVKKVIAMPSVSGEFHELNIGSGVPVSLNDLIFKLEKICQKNANVNYLPARNFDIPISYLDITKAKQKLGWEPKITLNAGLEMVVFWQKTQNY